MADPFDDASVLVTGGTGSFGKHFIHAVLSRTRAKRVVVFSRDELKQFEMAQDPRFRGDERIRYFLGDVRDKDRLRQAFRDIDTVVHAAALKQVPACEYNPFEAIKTNVVGAENIIEVAIDRGVSRVVALSTDKACNPVNLYGATKLCSDKLFVAGNAYAGRIGTAFAVVRYGNVVGSRGSVIPFFLRERATGRLPITHPDMTRFWITLDRGVSFVMESLGRMRGGELYVPKIPSMRILDLARAIGLECEYPVVGIRPGEKLHEMMISADDARLTYEHDDHYVIEPQFPWWGERHADGVARGRPVPEGFSYASDTNDQWLGIEALREMIAPLQAATRG
jgi:UDP-N-acetylglucosamine 4,6-dehydratase